MGNIINISLQFLNGENSMRGIFLSTEKIAFDQKNSIDKCY